MKKYIVDIEIRGLTIEELGKLIPAEQEVSRTLISEGILKHVYVKEAMQGALLIAMGEDKAHLEESLKKLPLYPYMHKNVIEVVNEM